MSTRLIKPRKNGCNLAKLPQQQLIFVMEMVADLSMDGTVAARKAGYKHPSVAACRLLGLPKIQAALGKVLRKRLERCELKADAVLNYLQMALFINPLQYFAPSSSGWWIVKDPETLPDEVGQLIEATRVKITEYEDGTRVEECEVRLFSKGIASELIMKHIGAIGPRDKDIPAGGPNWEELYDPGDNGHDSIEERILNVRSESTNPGE